MLVPRVVRASVETGSSSKFCGFCVRCADLVIGLTLRMELARWVRESIPRTEC
jgi:hypothetical protein